MHWLRLILLAVAALLVLSCDPGLPDTRYECICEVKCDNGEGVTQTLDINLCEPSGSGASGMAENECRRAASCLNPKCTCGCKTGEGSC